MAATLLLLSNVYRIGAIGHTMDLLSATTVRTLVEFVNFLVLCHHLSQLSNQAQALIPQLNQAKIHLPHQQILQVLPQALSLW